MNKKAERLKLRNWKPGVGQFYLKAELKSPFGVDLDGLWEPSLIVQEKREDTSYLAIEKDLNIKNTLKVDIEVLTSN